MREEIFGPVLPIVVVASEEEAIEPSSANILDFPASAPRSGTRDRKKGERMAADRVVLV